MTLHTAPRIDAESVAQLPEYERDRRLTYVFTSADNALRAGWAATALKAYAARVGGADSEPLDSMVGDLLADLRHLCDATGLDFAEVDASGHRHYVEELRGDH